MPHDHDSAPRVVGFPPIERRDARVLVLGTSPSRESLRLSQYYGNPRNAFWELMGALFGAGPELDYRDRCRVLVEHRVAVWDVAQECQRELSADQTIADVAPNDFESFLDQHSQLAAIFFNGKKSEQLFRRLVIPPLGTRLDGLHLEGLPSTSPAHAAMSRPDKLRRWRAVSRWV